MRSQKLALYISYIFSSRKQKIVAIPFLLYDKTCETDAFRYVLYSNPYQQLKHDS